MLAIASKVGGGRVAAVVTAVRPERSLRQHDALAWMMGTLRGFGEWRKSALSVGRHPVRQLAIAGTSIDEYGAWFERLTHCTLSAMMRDPGVTDRAHIEPTASPDPCNHDESGSGNGDEQQEHRVCRALPERVG